MQHEYSATKHRMTQEACRGMETTLIKPRKSKPGTTRPSWHWTTANGQKQPKTECKRTVNVSRCKDILYIRTQVDSEQPKETETRQRNEAGWWWMDPHWCSVRVSHKNTSLWSGVNLQNQICPSLFPEVLRAQTESVTLETAGKRKTPAGHFLTAAAC